MYALAAYDCNGWQDKALLDGRIGFIQHSLPLPPDPVLRVLDDHALFRQLRPDRIIGMFLQFAGFHPIRGPQVSILCA